MKGSLLFVFFCIICKSNAVAQLFDTLLVKECNDRGKMKTAIITDSSSNLKSRLQARYNELLLEGYIEATIDTGRSGHVLEATIVRGTKYLLSQIAIKRNDGMTAMQVNGAFNQAIIRKSIMREIAQLENHGYPFASLRIDSIRISSSAKDKKNVLIQATLMEGPFIVLDSLYLKSTQPLPHHYISNYLDFKSGEPYNEEALNSAYSRLKELAFLTIKQRPEIRFTPGKASLFVFAERRKANYFNGVAGIRPIENTNDITLTGDMEVRLLNAFNRGEEIGLTWRKLQSQTQDIEAKFMLPYVFKLPFGPDGRLKIYKRDTSYTSLELSAGLNLLLGATNRIRVFAEKNKSNSLRTYITPGPLSNANSTLYGLGARFEKLDYRWNPRKGHSINLEVATGTRTINTMSETLTESTTLTRLQGSLEYYIPLFKRHCIMIGAKGASLFAPSLYDNELLRIGGLRTIRGINEESIYASSWGVLNAEYRVLLEENSAVYVFADQAWYEKKGVSGFLTDHPLNFGAGFNFQTRAGIFTFNYALGKQFDNPILVRNGKVSFGFRNLF